MKRCFNLRPFQLYLLAGSIVTAFFFIFNPQNLTSVYGTGNGRYADKVDSFSEYIIRNTVKRNILNSQDGVYTPIVTKGYSNQDYSYYSDGYKYYYSNLVLQTLPITFIAKLLHLDTESKLDKYFSVLRLINAIFFSILINGILLSYCEIQTKNLAFFAPLLAGSSAGFIFFSQNLYFLSFVMILPAFYIARKLRKKQILNPSILIIFCILNFSRGFEFSTVFALLTAFSAAIFTLGSFSQKIKAARTVFLIVCISFIISIALGIIFIFINGNFSFFESAQALLGNLKLRTQTLQGVPYPFSTEFIAQMNTRWKLPAFSLKSNGFALSELDIIISMLFLMMIRLRKMNDNEKLIYIYGFFGYLSWYLFAYQHILGHSMYDWYIFSLTMGLSFSLLIIFYASHIIFFFQRLIFKILSDSNA